jgi:Mg-chelatase subunit ChlD
MATKKKVLKKKNSAKGGERHIVFLLDETGSMLSQRDGAISGFNEFVVTMKKDYGDSVGLTLTKFNSAKTETVCVDKKLSEVEKLTYDSYIPEGMTPLYDAIARSIKAAESGLIKGKVVFVVLTDGEENYSQEFDRAKIFDLIDKGKKAGWEFVFLGSNQDSWQSGNKIGIKHAMNYDPNNVKTAYMETCSAASSYFDTGSIDFTYKKNHN